MPAVLFVPLITYFYKPSQVLNLNAAKILFLLKNSFFQAGLSTLCCFFASLPAILYTHNGGKRLTGLIEMTYFIPYYFPVISSVIAFGLFFTSFLKGLNYTLAAVLIVHIFYNTPVFVKDLCQAVQRLDTNLIEAGELDCINKRQLLFHIIIPQLFKPFARAFFLVFTFCFTSFGVLLAFGNIGLTNFEVRIYTMLNTNLDITRALNLALIQFLILLVLNTIVTHNEDFELLPIAPANKKKKPLTTVLTVIYLLFELSVICISLFYSVYFSIKHGKNYFLHLFSSSFNREFPFVQGLFNSFFIAGCSALIISVLVYFLAKVSKDKAKEIYITSLFTISPIILSLALIALHILWDVPSFICMVSGYTLLALPVSYSFMASHIQSFPQEIISSAKIDGAWGIKLFFSVEFPILSKTLFLNILIIFAFIFGEFTIAYMFQNGDSFPLVSTVAYSLFSRRMIGEGHAINSLLILLIATIFLFQNFLSGRFGRKKETSNN